MENYLSENQIKEIRTSVDIVDVISDYIPLTAKGKNFFGVCPFHADHSPSMSVSREKQIYTCFSCGASGTVINFVMDYENIGFRETIQKLANKAGIEINLADTKKVPLKNQKLYEIYEISQKIYQNNLNSEVGIKAKEYLKDRQIDNEIIKEFGIGLSIRDTKLVTNILLKKGFKEKDLIDSGLIGNGEKGIHDIYYNRIMFPLWDLSGKVVGYSGRIYDMNDTSKYINTKETAIFKKGELLYNYHRAKEEARKSGKIIIVEGFMDVIAAYKVGIKNVIATMGTAVTSNQANLIKRMAKEIILCFDGDEAGAKATFSCSEELAKLGVIPKVVRLEDNLDPDEYIKKYGKNFIDKLENPISVMDFKLTYLKKNKNLSDNVEYSAYIESVLKEVLKTDDIILRELTLQKLSRESNLGLDILKEKLENMNESKNEPENDVIQKQGEKMAVGPNSNISNYGTAGMKAEQCLMYYLINNKEVVTIFNNNKVFLQNDRYRNLALEISAIARTGDIKIADLLYEFSDDEQNKKTITELLSLNIKDDYTKEEILGYINTIKLNNIKKERERLNELKNSTIDKNERMEIAKKIIELKQKEQEIKKEGFYGK